jgi:hypothetical protein
MEIDVITYKVKYQQILNNLIKMTKVLFKNKMTGVITPLDSGDVNINIFNPNHLKIIISSLANLEHMFLIRGYDLNVNILIKVNSARRLKYEKTFLIFTYDLNKYNWKEFYKHLFRKINSNKYKFDFYGKNVDYIVFDYTIVS